MIDASGGLLGYTLTHVGRYPHKAAIATGAIVHLVIRIIYTTLSEILNSRCLTETHFAAHSPAENSVPATPAVAAQ